MNTADRSCVIRLAEAQVGIPGPAGERAVMVLHRGTLDVKLSLPVPRTNRRRTYRTGCTSSFAAEEFSFTMASGTRSNQATSYSWLRGSSIITRTLPRILPCGVSSTARAGARSQSSVVLARWPDSCLELAEARLSDARVSPNRRVERTRLSVHLVATLRGRAAHAQR